MITLENFYQSKAWCKLMQQIKLDRQNEDGFIVCEHCGKPIVKAYDCIGHHKIPLTEENVNDVCVALNPDNIQLVHHRCHNRIHHKLSYDYYHRDVWLIYGAPLSGKNTYVVSSESDDKITIVIAPPELERLSAITGKSFDPETGMMVEGPSKNDYWAIMYRTKGTDGAWRYVSRLKGRFGTPEESTKTEDDGTETTNTSVEFTGIYTTHEFDKGRYNDTTKKWEKGSAKGIVVDERYGKADVSTFFEKVQTPDTIKATTASEPQTQSSKSSKSVN